MRTVDDLEKLIAHAEAAVAQMQDPDHRKIAFATILSSLLQDISKVTSAPPRPLAHPTAQKATGKPSRGGPSAYLDELVTEGFFGEPKDIAQVRSVLEERGHHIPSTALSGPLQRLCQAKKLRRKKNPQSGSFEYSNW